MDKNITCISCPLGCLLTVSLEGNKVKRISGATCKRGEVYAEVEVLSPTRTVTSTVPIKGSNLKVISVKTQSPIPKSKIFDCLKSLADLKIQAPVKIGDIIIENVCGTGANIAATRGAINN